MTAYKNRKWLFKNVRNCDLSCSYDVAGTGNVLWILIMAIVETGADYSGRYVCLAFLNNVAHRRVKREPQRRDRRNEEKG